MELAWAALAWLLFMGAPEAGAEAEELCGSSSDISDTMKSNQVEWYKLELIRFNEERIQAAGSPDAR